MNKYIAEFVGTLILVFCGTGAIIVNDLAGGAITHVGIAIVFGLVVASTIYTIGDVSGAHINPAVTLAFWFAKRLSGREVVPYVSSQLLGGVAASLLLLLILGNHPTMGATLPAGSALQSFMLEIVLTFILMLTIINVSTGAQEKGIMAGAAIGAVVGLSAMFAGPISGASMNPARSLGPALVSGQLETVWLYMSAPLIGSFGAILCCRCIREEGCCR